MNTDKKIKTYRKSRGWSQKELADRIGANVMTISRWESGAIPKTNSSAWHSLLRLMAEDPLKEPSH
jgi:transcriptional regulator with XRE-family HTH domain